MFAVIDTPKGAPLTPNGYNKNILYYGGGANPKNEGELITHNITTVLIVIECNSIK